MKRRWRERDSRRRRRGAVYAGENDGQPARRWLIRTTGTAAEDLSTARRSAAAADEPRRLAECESLALSNGTF